MSVDELKAGFDRLTATVTPDPNPYQQVLRRARRRRRNRFTGMAAAVAGVLALTLAGPVPSGIGGLFGGPPGEGYPVDSEWTWRLIESPTRGNLATDLRLVADLTDAVRVGSSLPETKVLFVHEVAQTRFAVVAHYSDAAASLSTFTDRGGATADDLAHSGGLRGSPVRPLVVAGESSANDREGWSANWQLGLAPAGCRMATSRDGTVERTGAVRRTWQPVATGDYVLREGVPVPELWQVTCDGRVRFRGPAGYGVNEIGDKELGEKPPFSARSTGEVDQPTAAAALGSYQELTTSAGLGTGRAMPEVRWGGWVTDAGRPQRAVVIGPNEGPGPVVLQVGSYPNALVALATRDHATPDDTETMAASRADWSLAATGTMDGSSLIAVRVPERSGGHAIVSDRLLVTAGPEATTVRVRNAAGAVVQSAPVRGGSATLRLADVAGTVIEAVDTEEKVLGTTRLSGPAAGERLFGEDLVDSWD